MNESKTIQLVGELKRIRERVPVRLDVDPVVQIPIFTGIANQILPAIPRRQSKMVSRVIQAALPKLTEIEQVAVKAQFGLMPGGETLTSAKRRESAARCYHYSLSHFRQRGLEEELFISLAEALIALTELSQSSSEEPSSSPTEVVHKSATTPRQLPSSSSVLIGRSDSLAHLDDSLAQLHQGISKTIVINAISGTPGIGKTALALHWSHRHREQFPDGDLFVNLHGYDFAEPAHPMDVLELFLRSLDVVPEKIPETLEQRVALYRSIMYGKKILVVLDNAANAQQIKPLLPAAPGCLVIVTSRTSLSSLVSEDSAQRIVLGRLSRKASMDLLSCSIGAQRVQQETGAAETLVDLCDGLPLALALVSEQVNSRPVASLALLVKKLSSVETRFDVFEAPDDPSYSLANVFEYSYRSLNQEVAELFCLLSLHAGATFAVESASALAAVPLVKADRLIQNLRALHLVEEKKVGEFEFHDLVRDYAKRVCQRDLSPVNRQAAIKRELVWYLKYAVIASSWLMPHREVLALPIECDDVAPPDWSSYDEALEWCEAQRANMLHATAQALDNEMDELAWKLPVALRGFYNLRKHWSDWFSTHQIALQAVKRAGDLYAEGRILNGLGTANFQLGRLEEARDFHELALDRRVQADDWVGQGTSLSGLGKVYTKSGQSKKAFDCYQRSMEIRVRINDEFGQGWSLNGLGEVKAEQGKYEDAVEFLRRSLVIRRKVKDSWGEGLTLHNLGCAQHHLRKSGEAEKVFESSLGVRRKIGDQWGVATTLWELAKVHNATKQYDKELDCLRESLVIAERLKDPLAEQVRVRMRWLLPNEDR